MLIKTAPHMWSLQDFSNFGKAMRDNNLPIALKYAKKVIVELDGVDADTHFADLPLSQSAPIVYTVHEQVMEFVTDPKTDEPMTADLSKWTARDFTKFSKAQQSMNVRTILEGLHDVVVDFPKSPNFLDCALGMRAIADAYNKIITGGN